MTPAMNIRTSSKFDCLLLYGGFVSPFTYTLHDIIGGLIFPKFSFISSTISDFTNSSVRGDYPLGVALLIISAIAGLCFAIGIIRCFPFRQHGKHFVVGALLATTGLFNILTAAKFPQDPIGSEVTFDGIMHVAIVGICAVMAIGVLLLSAAAAKKQDDGGLFRSYTFLTLGILIGGGILSVYVATQELPVLGMVERLSVYSFQIWVLMFTLRLIKQWNASFQTQLV